MLATGLILLFKTWHVAEKSPDRSKHGQTLSSSPKKGGFYVSFIYIYILFDLLTSKSLLWRIQHARYWPNSFV
ncbi:hypothetical protein M3215_08265 [Bacillus cytotoxicus]|uniref:Uncharacterized protein n=1 Tax=Bacillus cytotoxicus TaxID=580165 RepID=A0ACC6A7E9_9BACI|nr:hypothetical protein [Bacillus cytotoxicus]